MRPSRSLTLAGLLLRFFSRRVLRTGPLASRTLRVGAGGVLALLLVAATAGAVVFLQPLREEPQAWVLLLDVASVSTVAWSLAATLLVKTLFLNAEGMLTLSLALPVTNRERALAFLLYEVAAVAGVVGAGVAALAIASVVVRGPSAALPLLESVAVPAVLTYLVVALAHQLLARALTAVGLRRAQPVLLVLATFALVVTYVSMVPDLTLRASSAYLDGGATRPWTAAAGRLGEAAGHGTALAAAVVLALALAALTVLLTPARHVRRSRYLPVRLGRAGRRLDPYTWCAVRSVQTWLPVVLAAALLAALCARPLTHPLWALSLTGMGALYQPAATDALRRTRSGRGSAWAIQARLLGAQAAVWAACALPATLVVSIVRPELLAGAVPPLLASLAGPVLLLCVGIAFPAEDDNPLSVLVGLSVAAATLALVAVAAGALDLPPAGTAALAAGTLVGAVLYGVIGIDHLESRRRHEEGPRPRQRRRGSGSPDTRVRRRDAAGPHVLDR